MISSKGDSTVGWEEGNSNSANWTRHIYNTRKFNHISSIISLVIDIDSDAFVIQMRIYK